MCSRHRSRAGLRRFDRTCGEHLRIAHCVLITLVDEKRQWFKSKVGISANETSRDISFMRARDFAKGNCSSCPTRRMMPGISRKVNPLVTGEPKIRFYGLTGMPLTHPGRTCAGNPVRD